VARRGNVFIISGPSGVGKHTILEGLVAGDPLLVHSISATTRAPRPGEENGRDYHFLDRETFMRRVDAGDFVEWAEVHGNCYGTLREEIERRFDSGKDVILQLDVQGMRSMKAALDNVTAFFIVAPSTEELERRIRDRAADDEAAIAVRLKNARGEMEARNEFDHIILNDRIEDAVAACRAIVEERRAAAGES
jgi:guanylate kinase